MNSIHYHEYNTYICEKCKDTYPARYARVSDRTGCRYHHFVKFEDEIICRDCKITEDLQGSHNCYHTSVPGGWCCFQ
jgi:hypothetical protein